MVRGLDATAAQSFGSLRSMLQRMSVELIIVELENASATSLLHAHGVIGPGGCRSGICALLYEDLSSLLCCWGDASQCRRLSYASVYVCIG